jgi:eukaryotic-like serine/threonine-protein kinase
METPPSSVRVGQRLGIYHVEALSGHRGMGEVYHARDTRLGRDVAVKLLPLSLVSNPERCDESSERRRYWQRSKIRI